jgi:hypothetical protein
VQVSAEVSDYGDAAVVAIGYGRSGESPARIMQAWARIADGWQMVAFQGVRAKSAVTPSTQPSSALPPSSGPQTDREAIQKTLDAIDEAIRSGDAHR